jgi:hypothetical protein
LNFEKVVAGTFEEWAFEFRELTACSFSFRVLYILVPNRVNVPDMTLSPLSHVWGPSKVKTSERLEI